MRGDGRIYERGGKLWIAYYAPGSAGKRVQIRESSGSASRKVAKDLLKKRVLQRDMARARGMRFLGPEAERVTVGQILDSLESDYKARRVKSLRPVLQHIKRVRAHFGHWRAMAVTAESARNYVALRRADERADATIDRELEQLRAAFRLAKEEQVLGEVPKISGLGSRARNRRQVFFSLAEASDFFAAAAELDRDGFDYYRHLFLSGLRPSALRAFTWSDFNEDTFTLRIPSDKDKNREARTLAVEGEVRSVFESRQGRRYPGCEWIHHHAGRQLSQAWVMDFFRAACKKAGIPTGRKVHGGKTPSTSSAPRSARCSTRGCRSAAG